MNSPANLSVITKVEILGWSALTGSRKEKMTTFISYLHKQAQALRPEFSGGRGYPVK
ncbi:MAG: hypothetical protein GVY26_00590 [Bacteroidetes bacterium]|jgi:hypothetical protein|nr:hypothetical protein [Bacteroidota bacterium]